MTIFEIPLNSSPAQEFSVVIRGEKLGFRLKSLGGFVYMDFAFNNVPVFSGVLCKSNIDLLKVFRSIRASGALVFATENNNYPRWDNLGVGDKLYYVIP